MSVSLYRKYRPARFEDIIGQGHVARTLVNAIAQDRVSHAYLFTGPRGTGKTSTAKILAMALNCDAGHGSATAEPDGTCPHCEAIRRGSSLDVVEMDAASNRGIDDIRDLRDKVHFAPVESRMKVYIVDEVHMLTAEAFNALLKTLEEPPTHAVFILATTEPHKVPATILSRCQRFDFRRPSLQEVGEVLGSIARQEGIEVEDSSLIAIARAAGGSFRDAIGTLDQLATYSGGQISLEQTLDILGVVPHDLLLNLVDIVDARDTKASLLFVEQLNQAGTDYNQFMKDLLGYLRDLYVVKHTEEAPSSITLSDEQLQMLRAQAGRLATTRIVTFIDLLGEALRAVRQGSDPRLELELVLIKMTAFGHNARAEQTDAPAPAPSQATEPRQQTPASAPTPAQTKTKTPRPSEPATTTAATAPAQSPAPTEAPAAHASGTITADIDHLRRAWPVVLENVKKRQAALYAVLAEGHPESLEGDQLVVRFPAGCSFQAGQVTRGDNPKVLSDVLKEITGRSIKAVVRLTAEAAAEPAVQEDDARIVSKDELLRMLKQEFDGQMIDDGPTR